LADKAKANAATTPATVPLKKTTSIGSAADVKRAVADVTTSTSQTAKQLPKASFKSTLRLDLKSKGLSQSVVITPQGDKKVDFTGYNTGT